jgi:hypothetical protein
VRPRWRPMLDATGSIQPSSSDARVPRSNRRQLAGTWSSSRHRASSRVGRIFSGRLDFQRCPDVRAAARDRYRTAVPTRSRKRLMRTDFNYWEDPTTGPALAAAALSNDQCQGRGALREFVVNELFARMANAPDMDGPELRVEPIASAPIKEPVACVGPTFGCYRASRPAVDQTANWPGWGRRAVIACCGRRAG